MGRGTHERPEGIDIAQGRQVGAARHPRVPLRAREGFVDHRRLALAPATGERPARAVPPPGIAQGGHDPIHTDVEPLRLVPRRGKVSALLRRGGLPLRLTQRAPDRHRHPLHRRLADVDPREPGEQRPGRREGQLGGDVSDPLPHLGGGAAGVQAQGVIERGKASPAAGAVIVGAPESQLAVAGGDLARQHVMVAGEVAAGRTGPAVVAGAAGAPLHDLFLEIAAQRAADASDRRFDLVEGGGLRGQFGFQLAA